MDLSRYRAEPSAMVRRPLPPGSDNPIPYIQQYARTYIYPREGCEFCHNRVTVN